MTDTVPFTAAPMQVEAEWIDYNGHLNMAYYNVLFDRCVDQAFIHFGLGPEYVRETGSSFFTLEAHICYLREIHGGDRVRATLQILDYDAKRIHCFQELHHAGEGFLSATSESLCMHVDMNAKKSAAFPDAVLERIAAMHQAHSALPRPAQAGRVIAIRRKPG